MCSKYTKEIGILMDEEIVGMKLIPLHPNTIKKGKSFEDHVLYIWRNIKTSWEGEHIYYIYCF